MEAGCDLDVGQTAGAAEKLAWRRATARRYSAPIFPGFSATDRRDPRPRRRFAAGIPTSPILTSRLACRLFLEEPCPVADIVFVFDPALDRPIPLPDAAPPAIAAAISAAPLDALQAAFTTARETEAAAVVLFGRVLDPHRASPAQAAALRTLILDRAAAGCHTVWVTDDADDCGAIAQMLGDPRGLLFATPATPVRLDIRGLPVEILRAHGGITAAAHAAALPTGTGLLEHRVIVGWDRSFWSAERWDDATIADSPQSLAGWTQPGCHCVWGSRRPQSLPAGIRHVPPLQPRSVHETTAGGCSLLSLIDFDDDLDPAGGGGRWRSAATHRVAWKTITVESAAGGDEELATTIWSALESLPTDPHAPLQIIRCSVECGASVSRRVRVAEIAAETLARVRDLFDKKNVRAWCEELYADPGESLAPLGHARSGGRPGSTTSFSSALADIVVGIEHEPASQRHGGLAMPADMAREAGWLALELIESA